MLGLVIGTVCAVGVFSAIRRRARARYGFHGHGRRGRGWLLRRLFERLGTMPGQEKAILGALDELRAERAAVHDELEQTRADLARAVRAGEIDDAMLDESFARHDRLLARLRVSFVEAAKKGTAALDARQREILADAIEGRRWGAVWA